jgi:hypothetical protein
MMNGAVSAGSAGKIIILSSMTSDFIQTVDIEQAGAIYNEEKLHQHFQRKLPVKNSTGAGPFRANVRTPKRQFITTINSE